MRRHYVFVSKTDEVLLIVGEDFTWPGVMLMILEMTDESNMKILKEVDEAEARQVAFQIDFPITPSAS